MTERLDDPQRADKESEAFLEHALRMLNNATMRVGTFGNQDIKVVRRDEAEAILRDALRPAVITALLSARSAVVASGEPVAWRYRYNEGKGTPGMWKYGTTRDEVNNLPAYEVGPLFARSASALTLLERFGLAMLEEHRNEITDLDGGWIQDKAVELGLLVGVKVTEACSAEYCKCSEYGDFPQECLRETDAIRAKMAEYRATSRTTDRSVDRGA